MKYIVTLTLLMLFLINATLAQVPNNQDCLGAIAVCQSIYVQPNS